jgi:hypothetical protein
VFVTIATLPFFAAASATGANDAKVKRPSARTTAVVMIKRFFTVLASFEI